MRNERNIFVFDEVAFDAIATERVRTIEDNEFFVVFDDEDETQDEK